MKVAVVTHYFPTSKDPWAGHSALQTLRLLARRCDIHVFYPEPVYPAWLTPRARQGALDRRWRPGEVDVTYLPYPVLPVVSRPFNGREIARQVQPHVARFQPDILLSYVVYPHGYATVKLAHSLRIPAVLTAIGSDLNRIAPFCKGPTSYALRQADFVTTVSQDLCNTARSLGASPQHSRAILNGCDTAIFHPADRNQARSALGLDVNAEIVLYVGRLDFRKGLLELVEAMKLLSDRRPHALCYLVGNGPDEAMLHAALKRLQFEDAVRFVPPCATSDVARWMAAADLVTLPSYMEGCPNVVVEALSCGRPVVATRVGGIPELMDETCGRLVPSRDIPALAAALEQTLESKWDAQSISSVRSRSWQDVADENYTILEQTLRDYRSAHQTP